MALNVLSYDAVYCIFQRFIIAFVLLTQLSSKAIWWWKTKTRERWGEREGRKEVGREGGGRENKQIFEGWVMKFK